jgi:nicotinamidase/pyrazinamidase
MKTAFIDVDTQIDFMYPAGALYVPGAEQILPTLAKLNQYAVVNGMALISTADAHSENDPEFAKWPAHCVVGTVGQQKPRALLATEQIIIEKQHNDVFTNPEFGAVLSRLGIERCVVYGVVTEICVRCAAFGLLRAGRQVDLVTDAVRSLSDADSRVMLDEFTAAGGRLVTSRAVLA